MRTLITDLTIDYPYDDTEVQVIFNYTPGRPGIPTLSNGDPGYPEEPPELEILFVFWGRDELTQQIPEYIHEYIRESLLDRLYSGGWD